MAEETSLFKALLNLPFFQELDEITLTPEEEQQINREARKLLLRYFESLPAFQESKKKKLRKRRPRHTK